MQLVERVSLSRPFVEHLELFRRRPHPFLLDGEAGGRFSAMGADPVAVLRARRTRGRLARIVAERRGRRVETEGDPFEALRQLVAEHRVAPQKRPVPFMGGAVGWLGYGAGWLLEDLPDAAEADGFPDLGFGIYDTLLVRCHRSGETYVVAPNEAKRDELLASIARFSPPPRRNYVASAPRTTPRSTYEALVERAREHIAAGDAYELCLTHRVEARFEGSTWDLYRALRAINPAPFASYFEAPEGVIVSSSPERFLSLDLEGIAESRPIKGTRPRGATPAEDRALREELAASEKDRAENTMIVDLVRNDLGRVCRFGTVRVDALHAIEAHPTVYQMVSTIRGRLEEGKDAIDLVRAAFPPGSMTGAPKIEAMKILSRLEARGRGVYSGAIGWLDFSGTMDLAVAIRTFVISAGVARIGVGGAVTADSDPSAEYDETLHKARALLEALRRGTSRSEETFQRVADDA